jgi:hypothetical protein
MPAELLLQNRLNRAETLMCVKFPDLGLTRNFHARWGESRRKEWPRPFFPAIEKA